MHTDTMTAGQALQLSAKADNPEAIAPNLIAQSMPHLPAEHAVVEVAAAAVNQSDVKAALGSMPHAVWPRTPGRDFAGRVIAGPAEWLGSEVWGSGGDLGITRAGSHARYLVLPVAALSRKPGSVSLVAASAVGVPFITAFEGLERAGLHGAGQSVLVLGANGKVGQAAVQLASRSGATVIGVDRGSDAYVGHSASPVTFFNSARPDLLQSIRDAARGSGADIVFNTVGSPYFQLALDALAIGGTQVLISTIERTVPFDILGFYRRNLKMLGVDSLKLDAVHCASRLNALIPGFDDGSLAAFDIDGTATFPLEMAAAAYRRVIAGSSERVILIPVRSA